MTLSSTTNKWTYTGNGTTNTYSYTKKIFSDSDLLLIVKDSSNNETTLTITTDYTVTDAGENDGGTIVLVDDSQDWIDDSGYLESGWTLVIRRKRSIVQETDIRNGGTFYRESIEDELDKQIMIDQQQQEELDRSVKVPATSSALPVLPEPEDGKIIQWSGTGGTMINVAYDTTSLDAAVAAAQLAETNAETAETNAEAAETNAEAAQSAAEAAQSAAEAAQSAAEAAQSAAEAAAATIDQTKISDADNDTKIQAEESADEDILRFDIGGTEQITLQDGKIEPTTDNDIDLGASGKEFKDLYIDGTANIDSLILSSGSTVTAINDEDDMSSNSNTALATQQSIKAYVDNTTGKSNVVFVWTGNEAGSAAQDNGIYIGATDANDGTATYTDNFILLFCSNTSDQTLLKSRFLKTSVIDTVTIHAKMRHEAAGTGTLTVDIGGASASVTNTSTSFAWVTTADIDVSGLSDGTTYEIQIKLKSNSANLQAVCSAIVLTAS